MLLRKNIERGNGIMKKLIALFLTMAILFSFTACSGGETLSGKYYYVNSNGELSESNFIEFKKNNATYGGTTCNYSIDDDMLIIHLGGIGITYTLSKDRKEITDSNSQKYIKSTS